MCIIICETESPVQVQYTRQGAQGWYTVMTQRYGMGKEVGGVFSMGNTCTSMEESSQYMAKSIQYCEVISLQLININGNFFFLKNVIISLLKPVLAALAHHYACTCFFSFLKPDVSIHFVIYIKSLHIYQMTFIVVVAVLNELFLFFPLENIGVTKDYVLNTLKFSHCFFSLTL